MTDEEIDFLSSEISKDTLSAYLKIINKHLGDKRVNLTFSMSVIHKIMCSLIYTAFVLYELTDEQRRQVLVKFFDNLEDSLQRAADGKIEEMHTIYLAEDN